jgi:predicted enzyme related to lactoylglutathione lyase
MTTSATVAAGTAITGIDLLGCTVSDVERSLAFYRDTLGLTPTIAYPQGAEFNFPDGSSLGIWKPEGADPDVKPGFGVMFAVGDCRAAVELFRRRGATIDDAFESPVCVMAIGRDPDGNGFILHQRTKVDDPAPPTHVRTTTSINGIDLAAYLVSDPRRSIAFYRDVLGMTPTTVDELGRGAEFTLADGQTFGVWRPEGGAEGEQTSGGAMMFAVDDAHATVAELRKRGLGVSDPEDAGKCFMAFAKDPDGIGVIVHQLKVR